jgi:hypothetical protein
MIAQYLRALEEYIDNGGLLDSCVESVNELNGEMKLRIFNSEVGAKNANNEPIKKPAYSKGYANYRESKGRQTRVVDFEDTGSLRRSMQVQTGDNLVVIDFINQDEKRISTFLERRGGSVDYIFSPTENELQNVYDRILTDLEYIKNEVKNEVANNR